MPNRYHNTSCYKRPVLTLNTIVVIIWFTLSRAIVSFLPNKHTRQLDPYVKRVRMQAQTAQICHDHVYSPRKRFPSLRYDLCLNYSKPREFSQNFDHTDKRAMPRFALASGDCSGAVSEKIPHCLFVRLFTAVKRIK